MVQVAGKYTHVKNEKLVDQLLAFGLSEDAAKKIDSSNQSIEITVDGSNVTMKSSLNSVTYVLNQEIEEQLHLGPTVKSIAKLDGDTLTISSKAKDGKGGERIYKFSDTDLVMTVTSENPNVPTSKRFYKRA